MFEYFREEDVPKEPAKIITPAGGNNSTSEPELTPEQLF
jgi:hypothetical protein